jgi:hypothetical protein
VKQRSAHIAGDDRKLQRHGPNAPEHLVDIGEKAHA